MVLVWNWPQITWAVFAVLTLIIYAALNGQTLPVKYNFPVRLIGIGISAFILYQGGFWAGVSP